MVTRRPQPRQQTNSQVHFASLDGVRGVAILLVIIYHFSSSLSVLGFANPVFGFFRIGWCGVDVFFTLSGFLITGILLDTKSSSGYFRSFYIRRALRIFPLYFGSLLVVFLLRLALPSAGVWGSYQSFFSPGSLLWPGVFLENVAILPQGAAETGVMTHFWSLAVEEHFYLLWPMLVWLVSRQRLIVIALSFLALSILARTFLYLHGTDLDRVFALTPLRMDGLAIGAIASIIIRSGIGMDVVVRWARIGLTVSGILLFSLLGLRHSTHQTDPMMWISAYPLVAVITATVILVSFNAGPLRRVLSLPTLGWFGKYSFGLYVWHPIIGMILLHSQVALVTATSGKIAILLAAAGTLGLDLIVAWISYNLWEKFFLDLKKYFPSERRRPVDVPRNALDAAAIHARAAIAMKRLDRGAST
jgi:peptidoglycan/LPS O-acetylase OafA/YrhL